jgi:hypothetical protein
MHLRRVYTCAINEIDAYIYMYTEEITETNNINKYTRITAPSQTSPLARSPQECRTQVSHTRFYP